MEVSGQLHAPAATPRERAPGIHWIGGWVGPRDVLDAVVKRKIPNPLRESNRRTPIVQPVAQRYTDWATTAPPNKRAVSNIRGLTLLLWIGTLWRNGDGLFFEVPPLARYVVLTTLHPLLENVL
jgi:hypothetical protein